MAYLAMPADQSRQTPQAFIAWVDTYLKADASQPYAYCGVDVLRRPVRRAARLQPGGRPPPTRPCDPRLRLPRRGEHVFNPAKAPNLVLIGTASLLNDIVTAIEGFLTACQEDAALRARVETRLPKLLQTYPIRT